MMATVTIIFEKSSNFFYAFAENYEGVYSAGNADEEAKQNALEGLKLFKETRPFSEWPDILKEEYDVNINSTLKIF
jgi:predicted RNase H-like HicB family nuclease